MSIKPRTIKPFSYGVLALGLALLLGSTEAVGAQSDAEQIDSSSQVESLATSSESVSSLSESQVESAWSESSSEPQLSKPEQLQAALDAMHDLKTYQVRYGFTYIKDRAYTAQVQAVGDRSRGIAKIQLTYYGDKGEGLKYQLDLMTYDNLSHVYIKQSQLLASMTFFPELSLTPEQLKALEAYDDYYIELSKEQLKQVGLDQEAFQLLFLEPNRKKLSQLPEAKIHEFKGTVMTSAELTEIPEFLFDQTRNLHLDYRLKMEWEAGDKGPSLKLNPHLDLVGKGVGLDLQGEVSAKIRKGEFGLNRIADIATGKVDFLKAMQLKTSPVLQKLKRFSLRVNPKEHSYRMSLLGVVEDTNLNLFSSNPAYTRSYDYVVDYELTPSQEHLPDITELKRLSAQEYQSLLNKILSQTPQE